MFQSSTARSLLFVLIAIAVGTAGCSSPRTDLRTVLPGDALVYMEAKDLHAVVTALSEAEAFRAAAAQPVKADVLEGIELAVAVTGFETTEQRLNDEASVLNFQPRFVVAAETRLWNFQVISFTEQSLGSFINEVYGGEVLLETTDRHQGTYFVWTAVDGRKAFAYAEGSLLFFGNDESAIERALSAKRGEIDTIARNPKITDGERLAFAYVSPEGLAQLSNIAAVTFAKNSAEAPEAQGILAQILPELLRNSLRELTWTATRTEQGIEDRFVITPDQELAGVFAETIAPAGGDANPGHAPVAPAAVSVTRYDLRNPRVAWRSLLLAAERATNPAAGSLIALFSESLLEPYGIDDPEKYLSGVDSVIYTAAFDADGDRVVAIGRIRDEEAVRASLPKELRLGREPASHANARVWRSEEGEIAAAFADGLVITGDAESVLATLASGGGAVPGPFAAQFAVSDAVEATVGNETGTTSKVVEVLTGTAPANAPPATPYMTETRFNRTGFERRTVSSFGFLGRIVTYLSSEG